MCRGPTESGETNPIPPNGAWSLGGGDGVPALGRAVRRLRPAGVERTRAAALIGTAAHA
jgi:hypothetical protein